jgi:hypothetical protein
MFGKASMRAPDDKDEDFESQTFVNVVVLVVAIVLAILAYWAFNALEHSRRLQRCLDSGQRNCVDYVNPDK